jgi:hypothetical protein
MKRIVLLLSALCLSFATASELHSCAKGGHGFGMNKDKNPINDWPNRCGEWMKSLGYLSAK